MQNLEWTTKDKSTWPKGVWQNEPDKKQWLDESTGYPCLIVRNAIGALCGYVGVAQNHKCHGKDYRDIENDIEVHGSLTFADPCHPRDDPGMGICHLVDDGEDDNIWWFGFDCAHSFDFVPYGQRDVFRDFLNSVDSMCAPAPDASRGQYRDLAYVTAEVQSLAQQLKALEA